ncbi:MAG: DUF59 domain-containing protein, partial [Nitrososphaerota archaeon]|nr:DUF59 domain-containing protein [Nitrososphaerota archaeon]
GRVALVNKAMIVKELAQVVDPEVGIPITEMDLVDEIGINEGTGLVSIGFHLTAPFCPPMFAGQDWVNLTTNNCNKLRSH